LDAAAGEIVDLIEKASATTLQGLLVKARAINWCRASDPAGLEIFGYYPGGNKHSPVTDERLIVSVLADLHALTGSADA
jgi:hypothetical protein